MRHREALPSESTSSSPSLGTWVRRESQRKGAAPVTEPEAVASELLYGNNHNELQPTANATRAQAAAILQRFATKIVK